MQVPPWGTWHLLGPPVISSTQDLEQDFINSCLSYQSLSFFSVCSLCSCISSAVILDLPLDFLSSFNRAKACKLMAKGFLPAGNSFICTWSGGMRWRKSRLASVHTKCSSNCSKLPNLSDCLFMVMPETRFSMPVTMQLMTFELIVFIIQEKK